VWVPGAGAVAANDQAPPLMVGLDAATQPALSN